jgi:hypothetical protein
MCMLTLFNHGTEKDPSLQKADKLKGRTVCEEGWLLCLSPGSYLHCRGMSTKSIKDAILEQ